jgi:hypothetical protein
VYHSVPQFAVAPTRAGVENINHSEPILPGDAIEPRVSYNRSVYHETALIFFYNQLLCPLGKSEWGIDHAIAWVCYRRRVRGCP